MRTVCERSKSSRDSDPGGDSLTPCARLPSQALIVLSVIPDSSLGIRMD